MFVSRVREPCWGNLVQSLLSLGRPPTYPPTTIDNDGKNVHRHDVRQTLAYVVNTTYNINNVYQLYWITTKCGQKYHITTNAGVIGEDTIGTFFPMTDIQNTTAARGASIMLTGSGRVQLETTLRPTGGNFYYGGGGGIQLTPTGPDPSYNKKGTRFLANPTIRINGTITIDGEKAEIDPELSYYLFERQWGDFVLYPKGYYALWLYLESGEILISWIIGPDITGFGKNAFASIWHPNGVHEMIPPEPKTRAWEITTSTETGLKYFNSYFLDLPARNASFLVHNWVHNAELIPLLPEQRSTYISISESYAEGVAQWNGKSVKVKGRSEQVSRPASQA